MNRVFLLIVAILLITGCSNEKSMIIKGNYDGEGHDYIYLNRMDINIPVLVDSVKIRKSGDFMIRLKPEQPNFYNLGFDDNEFITVLVFSGDRIDIKFTGDYLQDSYSVSGSPESEKIRQLDSRLRGTLSSLDSLKAEYQDAVDNSIIDDQRQALEEAYLEVLKDQRRNNIAFILDNMGSLASIKALYQRIDETTYVLYEQRDLQYLKLVSDSLNVYFPNSMHTKALAENLENELRLLYSNRLSDLVEDVVPTALDASLTDVNGKLVKLSSLRNKYHVLITFWSAQSKECVEDNLYIKDLYNKYHDKGFEIYQVNIDNDEELWRSSVKFDELPWISVREDDPAYPETALLFNVSTVPSNYFLDKDGEIVAKDLFGKNLQIKLSQLFD